MKDEAKKHLFDALKSCEAIISFTKDKTLDEYRQDRLLRRGTEREFEIIGEALNRLRHLDPGLAASIASLPKIVDFRNRIIHGYDLLDDQVVWGIAQEKIPQLKYEVDKLLAE